jgi:hypothetical protein
LNFIGFSFGVGWIKGLVNVSSRLARFQTSISFEAPMLPRFLIPALLALPLAAQPSGPFGSWTLVSAPDLPGIIEAATAPMNFITRPIARSRLKQTNSVYRTIRIERESGGIAIQYDQRQPQRMPADGQTVQWTREDGQTFLISTRVDGDDLVQTYQAEDGRRTNRFHVDPASRILTLKVTVTSPRLPGPLDYAITYR